MFFFCNKLKITKEKIMRQRTGGGRSSSGKRAIELLPMLKVAWRGFFLQQVQKTRVKRI
jgi:hypothetical protein